MPPLKKSNAKHNKPPVAAAAVTPAASPAVPAQGGTGAEEPVSPAYMLYGFLVLLTLILLIGLNVSQRDAVFTANIADSIVTGALPNSDENLQSASAEDGKRFVGKARKNTCAADAFGPGRAIPLDSTGGPRLGLVQYPETLPVQDKEVIFTFDDGPHPVRTPIILDILDRHCIKAVFFMIGDMAQRYPDVVKEVERRGHVIGTHTWSHPLSLIYLSKEHAQEQIERGFAAVSDALGKPASPLFRFPGLRHSTELLDYLGERNISVWSVDVVSGDSEHASARRLPHVFARRLEARGRGILLFHDMQKATVESLETIIEDLADGGYRPAHVVPGPGIAPAPEMVAQLRTTRQQAFLRHGRARIR